MMKDIYDKYITIHVLHFFSFLFFSQLLTYISLSINDKLPIQFHLADQHQLARNLILYLKIIRKWKELLVFQLKCVKIKLVFHFQPT